MGMFDYIRCDYPLPGNHPPNVIATSLPMVPRLTRAMVRMPSGLNIGPFLSAAKLPTFNWCATKVSQRKKHAYGAESAKVQK